MESNAPDAQGQVVDGSIGHNDGDRRKKWWKDAGTVVPVVISIASLGVSVLSFWDLHQSREVTAVSQQQSTARLITPYFNFAASKLIVQNLSTTEITNLHAVVNVWVGTDKWVSMKPVIAYFSVDALPPCSSITALFGSNAIRDSLKGTENYYSNGTYDADPQEIIFEDSNQVYWEKSIDDNFLIKIDQSQASMPGDAITEDWEPIFTNNCQ